MRRLVIYITAVLIALTSVSCIKDKHEEKPIANRTVIVYIAADNNFNSFALKNILQMQRGWNNNFDGNLIVYVDRGNNAMPANPVVLNIKSSEQLDDTKIISPIVKTYPKANSCDANHFNKVIIRHNS